MKTVGQSWTDYLEQMFSQWHIKNTTTNYANVRGAYRELCAAVRVNPDDTTLVGTALKYFVPFCAATVKARQGIFLNIVNDTLKLLSRESSIDYIRSQAQGDTMLAWFCCSHSITYCYNQQNPTTESQQIRSNFLAVLNSWTSAALPSDTSPNLEFVVSLLYGRSCWDIYGQDVRTLTDPQQVAALVYEITHSNLPFAFMKHRNHNSNTDEPTILPNDLST